MMDVSATMKLFNLQHQVEVEERAAGWSRTSTRTKRTLMLRRVKGQQSSAELNLRETEMDISHQRH